jgi:hypothetical protein
MDKEVRMIKLIWKGKYASINIPVRFLGALRLRRHTHKYLYCFVENGRIILQPEEG